MKDITNKKQYEGQFSSTVHEEALKCAHDIRKFEIEMYWKRAAYFWAFIAAVFTGYLALLSHSAVPEDILVLLNCLGLCFSVCWYFVNRGSKFWQTNWEKHIEMLEDMRTGPLYKTVFDPVSCKWIKLNSMYGYSVSKVNQILSLLFVFVWIFLLVRTMTPLLGIHGPICANVCVLIGFTVAFIVCLLIFARTDLSDKSNAKQIFKKRDAVLK